MPEIVVYSEREAMTQVMQALKPLGYTQVRENRRGIRIRADNPWKPVLFLAADGEVRMKRSGFRLVGDNVRAVNCPGARTLFTDMDPVDLQKFGAPESPTGWQGQNVQPVACASVDGLVTSERRVRGMKRRVMEAAGVQLGAWTVMRQQVVFRSALRYRVDAQLSEMWDAAEPEDSEQAVRTWYCSRRPTHEGSLARAEATEWLAFRGVDSDFLACD